MNTFDKSTPNIKDKKISFKLDLSNQEISENDINRAEKNIQIVKSSGLPYLEKMNTVPRDYDTKLLSKEECLQEMLKQLFIACEADFISSYPDQYNTVCQDVFDDMDNRYKISNYLGNEKNIWEQIKNKTLDSQVLINLTWAYEQVAIYEYILGLGDKPNYNNQCDASKIVKKYFIDKNLNYDTLLQQSTLINKEEFLDYADLIYRLDWAIVQCHIDQKPFSLDAGIIREQKYALEKALNFDPLHYYKEGSLEITDK